MTANNNDKQRRDHEGPDVTETNATTSAAAEAAAGAEAANGAANAATANGSAEASGAGNAADAANATANAAATATNAETPSTPAEQVEAAQAEAQAWQDKYVRLHAEWDTYRRRMNEQRAEEQARATEKLVEALVPVIDDFERTIDYAEKNGEEGLLGGVVAVHTKLGDVLKRQGVEVIDPKGEAFNALEAQAVGTVDDSSVPDETVAEVYQKGYRMGNKVIRTAMVTVAVGGPKREAAEPAEAESAEPAEATATETEATETVAEYN